MDEYAERGPDTDTLTPDTGCPRSSTIRPEMLAPESMDASMPETNSPSVTVTVDAASAVSESSNHSGARFTELYPDE